MLKNINIRMFNLGALFIDEIIPIEKEGPCFALDPNL